MRAETSAALAFPVVLAVAALAALAADPPRSALAHSSAVALPTFAGATPLATGDFDRDGRDDLAIGVAREDLGDNKVDAGAVTVLYGSSSGLSADRDQLWSQASAGMPGALEREDGFGWATAAADFNGDGYDDLAIGAPLEDYEFKKRTANGCCIWTALRQTGAVNVLYGSATGLTAARAQLWHQGQSGIRGTRQENDFFGAALAAGDFNGDGRDDLAVGVPGEDKGAGAVQILNGSSTGLTAREDQLWLQDSTGVDDDSERGDAFGAALAAGNLGYSSLEEDLAIGVPGEDVGGVADAGAVAVIYGQPARGLSATLVPDRLLHQDIGGVDEAAEARDSFGSALAIGDFGRTAQGDLAVGVPGESNAAARQGAAQVFYGSSFGVTLDAAQLWYRDPSPDAELGRSLAAANFGGNSYDDLAIGAPYRRLVNAQGYEGAGAVHVIHGATAGLTESGPGAVPSRMWDRSYLPASGPALYSEFFGFALAAGAFRGSSAGVDLAASAPNAWDGAGFVHVLNGGGPLGLTAAETRRWHQDVSGVADANEPGDRFGGAY